MEHTYTVNELLSRIQAGENPEAIANEFASRLNDVMELDRKQKAAEAAAAAKAKSEKHLDELADIIANAVIEYVSTSNPEYADIFNDGLSGADVREVLDNAIKACTSLVSLSSLFGAAIPTAIPQKEEKSYEQILQDFLDNFVN